MKDLFFYNFSSYKIFFALCEIYKQEKQKQKESNKGINAILYFALFEINILTTSTTTLRITFVKTIPLSWLATLYSRQGNRGINAFSCFISSEINI